MEKPLLSIDPALVEFARLHSLEIERNYHSWPSRSLEWEDNVHRIIQILLHDEKEQLFNVWICAWEDRDNKRYWKDRTVLKSAPISAIRKDIEILMSSCFTEVKSWKVEDFTLVTKEKDGG